MTHKDKDNLLSIIVAVLTIVTVILSQYPDIVPDMMYRAKIWLAYRSNVNYDRLEYMRDNKDALYSDDMKASE